MKVMSRDFTLMEKLMLLLLVAVLLGLAYYYFVDQPARSELSAYAIESQTLQKELETMQKRAEHLKKVQSSLDELTEDENMSWMGSYNNSEAEVRFLNDILANTVQYSVTFQNVTRAGDQIRRNFSLKYVTRDYKEAQDIMTKLLKGRNRCLIGDVKCSISKKNGSVTMTQSATFYETMVGGTADAGLPVDSGTANK